MTEGHKHRVIRAPSWRTWWVRLLRTRPIHRMGVTPEQHRAVDRSPYPYGLCESNETYGVTCYTLSWLGILHRWFGLTLWVDEPDPEEAEPDE